MRQIDLEVVTFTS